MSEEGRSRRGFIRTLGATIAGVFAGGVATATQANATVGQPLVVGQTNDGEGSTTTLASGALDVTGNGVTAVSGDSSGVDPDQAGSPGIDGRGWPGVRGVGLTDSGSGDQLGIGILGRTGSDVPNSAWESDNPQVGVWGRSRVGIAGSGDEVGVFAEYAGSGPTAGGAALSADGNSVVGVRTTGSPALDVQGKALFSRSGVVSMPAGGSTITLTPAGGITSASIVFAVLTQNRSGVWVRAVTKNATSGTLTIHLNKAVGPATNIGWFIVN